MSAQHTPQRTCIGCRQTRDQDLLMRWAVEQGDGRSVVVPDPRRCMSGRGAWLHPTPECAALALKRRAFPRAFKKAVDDAGVLTAMAAHDSSTGGNINTRIQPESGSAN
ncbi:YlxR family protein [Paeniglutamicibacter cryotolerans]|uniref:YlxR family protein n=1 Tax=Paeniglutamicibacter cryotolerans TaxID=670079 RepID=UPI0028AA9637|nr:YlxR family protein [Paeniglutamicibacter cryotolerans]